MLGDNSSFLHLSATFILRAISAQLLLFDNKQNSAFETRNTGNVCLWQPEQPASHATQVSLLVVGRRPCAAKHGSMTDTKCSGATHQAVEAAPKQRSCLWSAPLKKKWLRGQQLHVACLLNIL